jgi:integrase
MPVSRQVAPWLAEFLDQKKPGSRQRYNQILAKVGQNAKVQVNPLRCRHTCGVILYHSLGIDAPTVQKLMGFTPQTMLTYVTRPISEVRKELADKGW